MTPYRYQIYGLRLDSEIPLPELMPAAAGSPDVTVRLGPAPLTLGAPSSGGALWEKAPGQHLLRIEGIARYLVIDGREVRIAPEPQAPDATVRAFLLGSVMGAVLHQRRLLVLHASAVATRHGAVLFLGRSGAGKSTTAAAFVQRGCALVADDNAVIVPDAAGIPMVQPGSPHARLSAETVAMLNISTGSAKLQHMVDKYVLPMTFHDRPTRVIAAYVLEPPSGSNLHLDRLGQIQAFEALGRHTYRRRLMLEPDQSRAHFQAIARLSAKSRVVSVLRPDRWGMIDELVGRLEADLEGATP